MASLKKKSKAGSTILPDSKTYYRASYEDDADARTGQQMGAISDSRNRHCMQGQR